MPELPEVETVRRGLKRLILNRRIQSVKLIYPKLINGSATTFQSKIKNSTLINFDRRGKFLFLRLDNNMTIVSHLRMEGQYSVEESDTKPFKHTLAIFKLDNNKQLFYTDTRKFGRMQLVKTGEEAQQITSIGSMGPEPTDTTLTEEYLYDALQHSNKMIKPWLLDQNNVAGIGNIYADEILWLTKLHPEMSTKQITKAQAKQLRKNIIEELALGIKYGGSTVHTFKSSDGDTGHMQDHLHAYGRAGEQCERRDRTTLVKIKVAQRGSTFCPFCQQLDD